MSIKAIVLSTPWLSFTEEIKAIFTQQAAYSFQFKAEAELTDEDFAETEVLIANPSPSILFRFKKLKWLQLTSAGTNGYTEKADFPQNVILTNATGTYGLTISEHMLTMTLVLMRKFNIYQEQQEKEIWENAGELQSIYGSTVLVHGLGDIGGHFAQKMKALGARVIAVKRTVYGDEENVDEVSPESALDRLLPQADVVASSVPGTQATHKLFNKERFAQMKPSAIFINVGRGTNVDLEALCDALEAGKLAGAGLDVTDPEPLPTGHRAWHTKNLLITPHAAGGYTLAETRKRFTAILSDNLKRYAAQQPLNNMVDRATGYKRRGA